MNKSWYKDKYTIETKCLCSPRLKILKLYFSQLHSSLLPHFAILFSFLIYPDRISVTQSGLWASLLRYIFLKTPVYQYSVRFRSGVCDGHSNPLLRYAWDHCSARRFILTDASVFLYTLSSLWCLSFELLFFRLCSSPPFPHTFHYHYITWSLFPNSFVSSNQRILYKLQSDFFKVVLEEKLLHCTVMVM